MRIGLIAGNGRFPFLVLDAARAQGHDVTIIATKEEAFPELNEAAKRTGADIHWISIGHLGKCISLLKDAGVEFNALLPAIGKMDQALVNEAAGEGEGLFMRLGMDAKALKNADPGEVFGQVMEKLAGIANAAERADIAKKLLGKGGLSFLSMARDPDAMKNAKSAVGSQAEILGANSGTFDRISDILGHVGTKARGFFVGVAAGLQDALLPVLERFDKRDRKSTRLNSSHRT